MKPSRSAAPVAAALAMLLATPHRIQANTTPALPTGTLRVSSELVRAGSAPVLNWAINYPSVVEDFVTVIPPATVNPKRALDMEIRVLGAGVTTSNSNGSNLTFVPTEARFSYDGGSFQRIFFGTNHDVDPRRVVHSATVQPNRPLRFGGRFFFNNSWGTLYTSSSGTQNVRTLVNGQVPPTTYPLHTAPTLENFIRPYLDAEGKVRIGPMDVIVFMELTHTDAQARDQGYDLQDMVLLVTFKTRG